MRRARVTFQGAYHHVMNRGCDGKNQSLKTFLIPDYKLIDVEKDKMFLVIEDETYYLFVYNLDI